MILSSCSSRISTFSSHATRLETECIRLWRSVLLNRDSNSNWIPLFFFVCVTALSQGEFLHITELNTQKGFKERIALHRMRFSIIRLSYALLLKGSHLLLPLPFCIDKIKMQACWRLMKYDPLYYPCDHRIETTCPSTATVTTWEIQFHPWLPVLFYLSLFKYSTLQIFHTFIIEKTRFRLCLVWQYIYQWMWCFDIVNKLGWLSSVTMCSWSR